VVVTVSSRQPLASNVYHYHRPHTASPQSLQYYIPK